MTVIDQRVDQRDLGSGVGSVQRYRWEPLEIGPVSGHVPAAGRALVVAHDHDESGEALEALADLGWRATIYRGTSSAEPSVGGTADGGPGVDPDLAGALARLGGAPDGIVDLTVSRPYDPHARQWVEPLAATVSALRAVYDDWASEASYRRCFYVPVTAMGGTMGYEQHDGAQPLGGIWAGLGKCLLKELPNCNVKVIDRAPGADLRRVLYEELQVFDLIEVGRTGSRRLTLSAHPTAPPPTGDAEMTRTALISGGGRGIGFVLAEALAGRGVSVVVTGRRPLPWDEELHLVDDDTFHAEQSARLVEAARNDALARVRRENVRREEQRQTMANLHAARRRGLDIAYVACDVTGRDEVATIVASHRPDVVVHNAGIDTPKRLGSKSVAEVLQTVAVKVDGFAGLLTATDADVRLCSVGSLAGRMGGMIGQVDYSAGNEGLARLGLWAGFDGRRSKVVSWPTWDRLGVIANWSTAIKYTAAIAVGDGVSRWVDELEDPGGGEVVYMGGIGPALTPRELTGYPYLTGHPEMQRLHTMAHHLGSPTVLDPFRYFESEHILGGGNAPVWHDLRYRGQPLIPPWSVLELLVAACDWVKAPGWATLRLRSVDDAWFDLSGLTLDAGSTVVRRRARGSLDRRGDRERWLVSVELVRADEDERAVARASVTLDLVDPLTVETEAADLAAAPSNPDPVGPATPTGYALPRSAAGLEWCSWVTGPPRAVGPDRFELAPCHPEDGWKQPWPPQFRLPVAAIDAALHLDALQADARPERNGVTAPSPADPAGSWTVHRLERVADRPGPGRHLHRSPGRGPGVWDVTAGGSDEVLWRLTSGFDG